MLPVWLNSTQGSDFACRISMGWHIRGGPSECELCEAEQNGNGADCHAGKGLCIHLGFPQFADLTHVARDAGGKQGVNKAVISTEKAEGRMTRLDVGYFSRTDAEVPAQERSQWRHTEMSS